MSLSDTIIERFRMEFLARIIYAISSGLILVVLARLLSPGGYGLLYLAISVLGLIKIFTRLGITPSTSRYISNYKETQPGQILPILKYSIFLLILIVTIVCFLLLILYERITMLFDEPDLAPFMMFGILYLGFSTLYIYSRGVLQGLEEIKYGSYIKSVRGVSDLVFVISLVLMGFGAIGAFTGFIIGYLISGLIGALLIMKVIKNKYPSQESSIENNLKRRIIEYAIPLTATSTADKVEKQIDKLLLGFFINPTAVAFYTIGEQLINTAQIPLKALGFTLAPSYESHMANNNPQKAGRIYEQGLAHSLIVYLPAIAGIIMLTEPIILLALGNDYYQAILVVQILSVVLIFKVIINITGKGLDYLGRARHRAIIKISTTIINVILNVILIPIYGAVGAAIATVVSFGIFSFANFLIMRSELEIREIWILRYTLYSLLSTAIMVVIVYPLTTIESNVIKILSISISGLLVWFVIMVRLGAVEKKYICEVIKDIT